MVEDGRKVAVGIGLVAVFRALSGRVPGNHGQGSSLFNSGISPVPCGAVTVIGVSTVPLSPGRTRRIEKWQK